MSTYDPSKITSLSNEKEVVSRIIEEYTQEMDSLHTELTTELEEQISGRATTEYVDEKIDSLDLSPYATTDQLSESVEEAVSSALSALLTGSTAVVELEDGQTLDDIDFSQYEEGTVVLVVGGEEDEA